MVLVFKAIYIEIIIDEYYHLPEWKKKYNNDALFVSTYTEIVKGKSFNI